MLCCAFAKGQDSAISVKINLSKSYQHINNFGASDAWLCQFIGNWPDEKKNKIADLLFSADMLANGSPKGIALSLWRFNIGAGSAQQDQQSGIKDEWRRAESFLNTDGSYNWQKQAGQIWFLKAAKARGVNQFLGFANSPPTQFTINGKAFANAGKTNLSTDKYKAFAEYLSSIVKGIAQASKVKLNYISPVNEPQWDWSDGGQEGCPYNNIEIAGLVRAIDKAFIKNKTGAKVLIAEAGNINYLLASGDKPGKGNQLNDFFHPASVNYIGNLPSVNKAIAGHSYFTTSPKALAIKKRLALADSIAARNIDFWQSEYCILGDNAGEIDGRKRDLGIDAALYLASVIHTDLTVANASAWHWWTAISAYNYKDGLIYVDKNKTDGNYYDSKMLWVLGNYSRFIRPGAVRVDATVKGNMALKEPLLVSAFKNGKNITVVIVNQNMNNALVNLNINDNIGLLKSYTTSQTKNLEANNIAYGKNKDTMLILARSVTTLTGVTK
ncbi:xylanase [Mucilaginibacter boryungensis]|uniref:Xylanase n=2 Tax=Mucilaginibacter boryungensis TaxID=768480 RepID=A0ABR9XFR1_9SPHI|nr:xylanase [Mucilaginibacter boryungensis]